jgi:ArsR family transcriptional regulator
MPVESMAVDSNARGQTLGPPSRRLSASTRTERVLVVARALADPTRFRILLGVAARRELSCQELTRLFRLAQATVSHHLRILAEAGLVSVRAEGPFHYYRARPDALAAHGRALARAFPARAGRIRSRTRGIAPRRGGERRRTLTEVKKGRTP